METRLWPSQQCLARVTNAINHSPPTAQGGIHPRIALASSTFTDTTPLSRPSVKWVHRGWKPILSAGWGCQSSLTAGCSSGDSATLVSPTISCCLLKQPAGTGRSVNLWQGPCLPSELASRSAVKPQEQRYCLIVLINIVTRCSPDPSVGRENPREATSFTTRSLKPALQTLPSPPRCPPG